VTTGDRRFGAFPARSGHFLHLNGDHGPAGPLDAVIITGEVGDAQPDQ